MFPVEFNWKFCFPVLGFYESLQFAVCENGGKSIVLLC